MAEHDERDVALDGRLDDGVHLYDARIYFADTDFSGFVYHARYLEFLERGRTDHLRLTGMHHSALAAGLHGEAMVWVVRRMEIDFLAPARIDEIVTVETRVESVGGARIAMRQSIRRGATALIAARVEAALVTPEGRPRRLPKAWAGRFEAAAAAALAKG